MEPAIPTTGPVWKQPRGSYGSNYWEFYSPKIKRMVHFYSDLERDHGILVEADPLIVWFCEQPIRVKIKIDGYDRETILDMLVRFKDGREEYREVKYARDLAKIEKDSQLARQLKAQLTWCVVTANQYRVVTDEEIRHNPLYLQNWKRIVAHLAANSAFHFLDLEKRVFAALLTQPVWQLGDLERYCDSTSLQLARAAIFRLIHRGELEAPLDEVSLTRSLILRRRIDDPTYHAA